MAVNPYAIGGFEARHDLQLASEVAQNCFPEIRETESQFRPRERVAMLPTRGHRRFAAGVGSPRVSALAGTRERPERLAVSFGRTLRLYEDPDDASAVSMLTFGSQDAAPSLVVPPVRGAFSRSAGGETWFAATDGTIRVRSAAGAVETGFTRAQLGGQTARGLTGDRGGGLVWASFVEEPLIRCWQLAGRVRDAARDLDVSDTSCQMPESLYYLASESVMAVCDANGDVYLFHWDGKEWKRISPDPPSLTFSLQFAAADPALRRPAVPAGVWLSASELKVANLHDRTVATFSRGTGGLKGTAMLPAAAVAAGGFAGGETEARLLAGSSIYTLSDGSEWLSGLTDPEETAADVPTADLVPLDDSARYLGWRVERKFHLVDLRRNRVLRSAAVGVDQITAADGRFIGCDRAGGRLKVSDPAAQILSEPFRRKSLIAAASIVVPGWPRVNSRALRSVYVGSRYVLALLDDYKLYRYDRQDMEADPVHMADAVTYVTASGGDTTAGQCVLLTRGSSDSMITIRWFDDVPTTGAEITDARATQLMRDVAVPAGRTFQHIRAAACDDDYVFLLYVDSDSALRSRVYRRSDSAEVGALGGFNDPDVLGVPKDQGYTEIRGIDVSGGVLRASVRSTQAGDNNQTRPTIIQAIARNGETGWVRRPEDDIGQGIPLTRGTALSHDALYVYDLAGTDSGDLVLADGTPTQARTLVAYWLKDPNLQSKYRWLPDLWQQDDSIACFSIRGRLYSWSATRMRIYQSNPQNPGFPYQLAAVRDVGCAAPDSLGVVEEQLFWIGVSPGGGTRPWVVGAASDQAPEAVVSQAVEEAIEVIGEGVFNGVGWTDDNGGHPTWVCGWRDPGLTLCYDTHSREWHTRTSLRLGDPPGKSPFDWQSADQGHYRVEHSTQWRGRQFLGGYGAPRPTPDAERGPVEGIVCEPTKESWLDVDGEPVERVRVFRGEMTERRLARFPGIRVDAVYGLGSETGTTLGEADPSFTLEVSNDGGRTWGPAERRGLSGRRPPRGFYRLGNSRFRAYRVVCGDPVEFIIKRVTLIEPRVARKL